jgi:t-SNARE complex subunit (syntaxin)
MMGCQSTVTAEAAGQYQDIKILELSIADLHQVTFDLALLVKQQGELLDNMESQVFRTMGHIEIEDENVYQNIERQKRKDQV